MKIQNPNKIAQKALKDKYKLTIKYNYLFIGDKKVSKIKNIYEQKSSIGIDPIYDYDTNSHIHHSYGLHGTWIENYLQTTTHNVKSNHLFEICDIIGGNLKLIKKYYPGIKFTKKNNKIIMDICDIPIRYEN